MVTGPMVMNDPRGVVVNGSQEAGYAVIGPGGPEDAAGYAIVGGPGSSAEPTPIGLARGGMNPWADPRMAAMSPRPVQGLTTPQSSPPPCLPPRVPCPVLDTTGRIFSATCSPSLDSGRIAKSVRSGNARNTRRSPTEIPPRR